MKPLMERLNELGYADGRNLTFEYRSAEGDANRLAQLAAQAVQAKPDVLIAGFGTLAAKAAQAATATIPIVFTSVGDPIGAGLIQSLSRPGANVTGTTSQASDIGGKRLQILEECLPKDRRVVAVLLNPQTPFSALALQELKVAAEPGGIHLEVLEATTADQVTSGFEVATRASATGLIVIEDPFTLSLSREIADLAAKSRLPAIYGNSNFVTAGGLMSYGVDRRAQNRRAADYVDRILKGAKPADLPVEQPTKFELVINLKAAKALGLRIPDRLIALADSVIE